MLALAALLPHLPGNPRLPCPLRAATGVPCPFCGCTTAIEAVMHASPRSAVAASPLGVLAAAFAVFLVVRPRWSRTHVPIWLLILLAGASWVFELGRYGFL